ncbi:hypothetical protein [Sulfurimonas sp.]|jgi:hypothetical protein|uniref:hypothetical protein n=1 Tax=Sulfurimonas sp. TaxID=2022749 RepID=UPI0025CCD7FF|nr:hypothetical protein [Sulfurimonas sp.]MBT5935706.1 hypothetical protein [Sulfurimonas sp.]
MKKIFLIFIALLAVNLNASQFGLKMGMSLKQIDKNAKKVGNGVYFISVPKPHSAFDKYVARICPKKGLYYIKAIGKDISTNGSGYSLQTAFDNMEAKLTKAYGKHNKIDFLSSGSLWDKSHYWMMGLLKQDRYLIANWNKKEGSKLKDNLSSVGLGVSALSQEKGYISIDYTYSNSEECEKELAAMEDDAL